MEPRSTGAKDQKRTIKADEEVTDDLQIQSSTVIHLMATKIDVETFTYAVLIALCARLAFFFSIHPFTIFLVSLLASVVILLLGMKLARIVIDFFGIDQAARKGIFISLSVLLGVGAIYFSWTVAASILSLPPLFMPFFILPCLALPPRLNMTSFLLRKLREIRVERKSKATFSLFSFQILLIALVSASLVQAGNRFYSKTIFDGASPGLPLAIFGVFLVTIILIANPSYLSYVSVYVAAFWIHTFLLLRGFVYGGDTGDNVAVVKFLLQGGYAPFFAPSIRWRWGSFSTLNLHSNVAFLSQLISGEISLIATPLSMAFQFLLFLLGSYALCKAIFKGRKMLLLAVSSMAFLQPSIIRHVSLHLRPVSFLFSLFPAYAAFVMFFQWSAKWWVLFFILTGVITTVHPLGWVIGGASLLVILLSNRTQVGKFISHLMKKKALVSIFLLITVFSMAVLFNENLHTSLCRILSLPPDMRLGIFFSSSSSWDILSSLNDVSMSKEATWRRSLQVDMLTIFIGLASSIYLSRRKKLTFFKINKLERACYLSLALSMIYFVLDFFVKATPNPMWRLIIPATTMSIPISYTIIVHFLDRCISSSVYIRLHVGTLRLRFSSSQAIAYALLGILLTCLFISSAYPTEQSLNYASLSVKEHELLTYFIARESSQFNRSLILSHIEVLRTLEGMYGAIRYYYNSPKPFHFEFTSWEESAPLWNAYSSLVYQEDQVPLEKLALEKDAQIIYIVVLFRLVPSIYIDKIQQYGQIVAQNPSGFILKVTV